MLAQMMWFSVDGKGDLWLPHIQPLGPLGLNAEARMFKDILIKEASVRNAAKEEALKLLGSEQGVEALEETFIAFIKKGLLQEGALKALSSKQGMDALEKTFKAFIKAGLLHKDISELVQEKFDGASVKQIFAEFLNKVKKIEKDVIENANTEFSKAIDEQKLQHERELKHFAFKSGGALDEFNNDARITRDYANTEFSKTINEQKIEYESQLERFVFQSKKTLDKLKNDAENISDKINQNIRIFGGEALESFELRIASCIQVYLDKMEHEIDDRVNAIRQNLASIQAYLGKMEREIDNRLNAINHNIAIIQAHLDKTERQIDDRINAIGRDIARQTDAYMKRCVEAAVERYIVSPHPNWQPGYTVREISVRNGISIRKAKRARQLSKEWNIGINEAIQFVRQNPATRRYSG